MAVLGPDTKALYFARIAALVSSVTLSLFFFASLTEGSVGLYRVKILKASA